MGKHNRACGRHRKPAEPINLRPVIVSATAGALTLGGAAPAWAGPNWDPIIQCESGGDPTAQNPNSSASGLFQFIDGTWRAFGGGEFAPRAYLATPAEQEIVADRAFAANGLRDWEADPRSEACWSPKRAQILAGVSGGGQRDDNVRQSGADSAPAQRASKARSRASEGDDTGRHRADRAPRGSYVVRAGDTLGTIAAEHGTTWQRIFAANRDVVSNPDVIFPGERLKV